MNEENKGVSEERVSLKDIRQTFYDLRSFEIKNLWQRSVFLATLLVVLVTGYGYLFVKLLEGVEGDNAWKYHLACCAVSCLGLIFSAIWIIMAKGSKAWYEVYEKKIMDIEGQMFEKKLLPMRCYDTKNNNLDKLDINLLSCDAGQFSVSKLNILIGQVLGSLFALLTLGHAWGFFVLRECSNVVSRVTALYSFLLLLVVSSLCPLIQYLKGKVKSSSLTKGGQGRK